MSRCQLTVLYTARSLSVAAALVKVMYNAVIVWCIALWLRSSMCNSAILVVCHYCQACGTPCGLLERHTVCHTVSACLSSATCIKLICLLHAAAAAAVLNDFEAVGYGIPALGPDDLVALNDAPMVPKAPKVSSSSLLMAVSLLSLACPGAAGAFSCTATDRQPAVPALLSTTRPVLLAVLQVVMGPGTGLGAAQLFWDTGLQVRPVVAGSY
jgi:hypothetical protein